MLTIKKVRAHHVIDFAAEELKEYLRMMMPEDGEIDIVYDPEAKDGFRLGLLEDFGLENEAEDPYLDDVIHVDTTPEGGILAGSNPRSVLFSVYRFLRENGCRWLYPGVDGDFVPVKKIEGVKYHKIPDHRFRGFCNEGAESQQCMMETIDFYAKLELNVYMLEFKNPFEYYHTYYSHAGNLDNRIPEPVPTWQTFQWKRMCETEMAKRGLMFHDMGHGWSADPFGMDTSDRKGWKDGTTKLTDYQRSILALRDGKRELYRSDPQWTNLCYSRPDVRSTMADAVVEYAKNHGNVDYLHVWLGDFSNNHCECEECQKLPPSDWYMMLMNEIDEKLAAAGLDTRIVFIAYVDTLFAPTKVVLNNPKRFSMLFAPISRSYSCSIKEDSVIPEPKKYVRNAWEKPVTMEENLALLKEWFKLWKGDNFTYEYHFWRHQVKDPGGQYIARRIYEDVQGLKFMNMNGCVEDGSQRSFFPNGFPVYIYAETLMDRNCDYEKVREDYFSHIYGEDWKEALSLLSRISQINNFSFLEGEESIDETISLYYDPEQVPRYEKFAELASEERALVAKHMNMPTRVQTVSWRLLGYHATYLELYAEIVIAKAKGHNFKTVELLKKFKREFGKYEIEIERYYDHGNTCASLNNLVGRPQPNNIIFV